MAQINEASTSKKNGYGITKRSKKSTSVDLTPMVDLGFLLITFFMFATTLAQPSVAKFRMPFDTGIARTPIPKNNTLIIVADSNNKYFAYEPVTENIALNKLQNIDAVRDLILTKKKTIMHQNGNNTNVYVVLKFTENAKYNSLVELLDEMTINAIEYYIVDKLNDVEKKQLH
jgi:biopolymer transport protein ExbD